MMNTQIAETKKVTTRKRYAVTLRIDNTDGRSRPQFFTRVRWWDDGSYDAQVRFDHDNGLTDHPNLVDEMNVYINPGPRQLKQIVDALNDGRLSRRDLKRLGGWIGGKSELYIPA